MLQVVCPDVVYSFQATDELSMMRWIAGLIQESCRIKFDDKMKEEEREKNWGKNVNLEVCT